MKKEENKEQISCAREEPVNVEQPTLRTCVNSVVKVAKVENAIMPKGYAKNGVHKGWFKKGVHPSHATEFKKGQKISDEMKQKMRERCLKNRDRISNWVKRAWDDPQYRLHNRLCKIGNKNARGKHPSMAGSNHPNWIKDRSKLAKRQERNDMAYKEWRRLVKTRDRNICQLKDATCQGYTIAAHIKGWALYPELRYKVNNGITLCQRQAL